jgi:hypothetical protein
MPQEFGLAVASVWLILILSGRWRSHPDWIDRLGRGLGALWMLWALVEEIEPWSFLEKEPALFLIRP